MMYKTIFVWVRDHKTKTNHEYELWGFDLEDAMEDAKWDLDELYPDGYIISF